MGWCRNGSQCNWRWGHLFQHGGEGSDGLIELLGNSSTFSNLVVNIIAFLVQDKGLAILSNTTFRLRESSFLGVEKGLAILGNSVLFNLLSAFSHRMWFLAIEA